MRLQRDLELMATGNCGIQLQALLRCVNVPITNTKSQLFLHIIYTYLFKFCLFICNALNRNYICFLYSPCLVDLVWVSKVVGEPACSTAHDYNLISRKGLRNEHHHLSIVLGKSQLNSNGITNK